MRMRQRRPEVLKRAGYRAAIVDKWHVGEKFQVTEWGGQGAFHHFLPRDIADAAIDGAHLLRLFSPNQAHVLHDHASHEISADAEGDLRRVGGDFERVLGCPPVVFAAQVGFLSGM
jgi:arylsulfatase A-like enzyme